MELELDLELELELELDLELELELDLELDLELKWPLERELEPQPRNSRELQPDPPKSGLWAKMPLWAPNDDKTICKSKVLGPGIKNGKSGRLAGAPSHTIPVFTGGFSFKMHFKRDLYPHSAPHPPIFIDFLLTTSSSKKRSPFHN